MATYAERINDSVPQLKKFLGCLGRNVVVLSHVDADGLCAAAMLKRFLRSRGINPKHIYPGRGENAYNRETTNRLRQIGTESLFVVDLGVMADQLLPGIPTLFIDHHRPFGHPDGAVVISSYGTEVPYPASLLTYDLLSKVEQLESMRWLYAVGTAGDMGANFVFDHAAGMLDDLKKSDVREAEILINSAKRSSEYDIDTPIKMLDDADDIARMVDPDTAENRLLSEYRAQVNSEVKRCRHERPQFSWKAAIVAFKSRCDIQGLVAETWRRQLNKYLVIAANFGYIEGRVAYVIRTALDTSVIDFMESLRPADCDFHVVFGHDRAAGAVLDRDTWLYLVDRMGFGKNI
jgi:single-stranded-DNA-specific exonuclease